MCAEPTVIAATAGGGFLSTDVPASHVFTRDDLSPAQRMFGRTVECSINKVWTSQALAFVVDESLQVYGGYGYSKEFPAERPPFTNS